MLRKAKQSYYRAYYKAGAVFTAAFLGFSGDALAIEATISAGTSGGNNFSSIARNIVASIASLPGLISAFAYLSGTLFGVLGIMKIKEHVESPGNAPLQHGAIRLAAGGALFALPVIYEAMFNTIGTGQSIQAARLNAVDFVVN